jgi:hypothetical protein
MTGATTGANGTTGIVPGPLIANRLQFLRGDATWATPTDTNTTYSVSTVADTTPYTEIIRLTAGGSGSGNDDIKVGVGATTAVSKPATTNSTTTVAIADTSGILVGHLVTGSGIPANTLVSAITTNVSITITNAATSSGNFTLAFGTFGLTIDHETDLITFRHADTSTASDLGVSARRYVTGLTFDTFGHVTGYSTATETVVNTNTATAEDDILDGSNSGTQIKYAPYTTAASGKLSSTSSLASSTSDLAYSGYFYANRLYEGEDRVYTEADTFKLITADDNDEHEETTANNNNLHLNLVVNIVKYCFFISSINHSKS